MKKLLMLVMLFLPLMSEADDKMDFESESYDLKTSLSEFTQEVEIIDIKVANIENFRFTTALYLEQYIEYIKDVGNLENNYHIQNNFDLQANVLYKGYNISYDIGEKNVSLGVKLNSFSFGIEFDTKTYMLGDKKVVTRRPKINASYKNIYDFGWISGSYKLSLRWINPKKLMYISEIFPPLPLIVEDQGSELEQRVLYGGLFAEF